MGDGEGNAQKGEITIILMITIMRRSEHVKIGVLFVLQNILNHEEKELQALIRWGAGAAVLHR